MLLQLVALELEEVEVEDVSSEDVEIESPLARVDIFAVTDGRVFRLDVTNLQSVNHIRLSCHYSLSVVLELPDFVEGLRMLVAVFESYLALVYIEGDRIPVNIECTSGRDRLRLFLAVVEKLAFPCLGFGTFGFPVFNDGMEGRAYSCILIARKLLRDAT